MRIIKPYEAQFINPYNEAMDLGRLQEGIEYGDLIENISHNLFQNKDTPNSPPHLLNFLLKKDYFSVKFNFVSPLIKRNRFVGTEKQTNKFINDIYKSLCEKAKEYVAQKKISEQVKAIQKKVEIAKQEELQKKIKEMKKAT